MLSSMHRAPMPSANMCMELTHDSQLLFIELHAFSVAQRVCGHQSVYHGLPTSAACWAA